MRRDNAQLDVCGLGHGSRSPANTSPKLIRFLAKANQAEYVYAAQNQWWSSVEVVEANQTAHDAIKAYLQQYGIAASPWLSYKLVNVQYFRYDKIPDDRPNGSPYQSKPPYTAHNPSRSTYYQANIVVETDRSLQLFSGGLVQAGGTGSITDWDMWMADDPGAAFHKNSYYGGGAYNMGGCMGCYGSQGQNLAV
jgi:hypothetical protein